MVGGEVPLVQGLQTRENKQKTNKQAVCFVVVVTTHLSVAWIV